MRLYGPCLDDQKERLIALRLLEKRYVEEIAKMNENLVEVRRVIREATKKDHRGPDRMPFDIARARQLREQGCSMPRIARLLGMSTATVHRRLSEKEEAAPKVVTDRIETDIENGVHQELFLGKAK